MDEKKLKEICKMGQGEDCCKFIVCGPDGFECAKGTSIQKTIEDRIDMIANSNNCKGEN